MPPLASANKSKNKHKTERHSRSRNTTPSSVISASAQHAIPAITPFLELDTSKLLVAPHPSYADILDKLETKPSSLEPRTLQEIIEKLTQLNDHAEKRTESCERAIRLIHEQLRDLEFDHKERERQAEHTKRLKAKRDKDDAAGKKVKAKKRKDRAEEGDVNIKREDTPGAVDTPSPSKKIKNSPGTSPLSDPSSPKPDANASSRASPAQSDVSMSEDNRVVRAPPRVPATGFFPDPLAPDPTVYHIRSVTPTMSEADKKEIYSVTSYPTVDLTDQIAGTIPDKDFSNAKPSNQIAANTFLTYIEPYVRPLAEEDMAFLRERGDRVTPFLSVPRSRRNYHDVWADEDGIMTSDTSHNASTTAPRGSLDQLEEDTLNTDSVSTGPLAARLLSLLKFEHRPPPADSNGAEPNAFTDGADTMDLDGLPSLDDNSNKPPAPSTAVADLLAPSSKVSQKLDYLQSDERIKAELRHLGLLPLESDPNFDAHNDDDISERLRLLQAELRKTMVINGARKARLLDLAKERLAYQEYSTIHDDLDSQVQQAYLKRTRTLGKTKKGAVGKPGKPGLASSLGGGIGAYPGGRRDIGDNARMLMDRRKRWQSCIGPVFKDMRYGIPGVGETIFPQRTMEGYEKAEVEAMEEEAE